MGESVDVPFREIVKVPLTQILAHTAAWKNEVDVAMGIQSTETSFSTRALKAFLSLRSRHLQIPSVMDPFFEYLPTYLDPTWQTNHVRLPRRFVSLCRVFTLVAAHEAWHRYGRH